MPIWGCPSNDEVDGCIGGCGCLILVIALLLLL